MPEKKRIFTLKWNPKAIAMTIFHFGLNKRTDVFLPFNSKPSERHFNIKKVSWKSHLLNGNPYIAEEITVLHWNCLYAKTTQHSCDNLDNILQWPIIIIVTIWMGTTSKQDFLQIQIMSEKSIHEKGSSITNVGWINSSANAQFGHPRSLFHYCVIDEMIFKIQI